MLVKKLSKQLNKGKIIIVPSTLGSEDFSPLFPETNQHIINTCDVFIVEKIRSARRFLKKINISKNINDLYFFELNKHESNQDYSIILKFINEGKNIALVSEAGYPCIADPGSKIIKVAHLNDIKIIPLIGPSSILMSIVSSGLNGQNFSFVGYLPIDKLKRMKRIKELEQLSKKNNQTQIFIEAPYRNNDLFKALISSCNNTTLLSISSNLTLPNQIIKTLTIEEWKYNIIDLNKKPTVFLIHKY